MHFVILLKKESFQTKEGHSLVPDAIQSESRFLFSPPHSIIIHYTSTPEALAALDRSTPQTNQPSVKNGIG